jgi:hypothetical protein
MVPMDTVSTPVDVTDLVSKFQASLEALVASGHTIPAGVVLTKFDIRLEFVSNGEAFWLSDDGQKFITVCHSREADRPLAPVIPGAIKALKDDQSAKKLTAARDAVRKMRLGFYAMRESRLCGMKPSRTLPGVNNARYHSDTEIAEFQKYADAKGQIGL